MKTIRIALGACVAVLSLQAHAAGMMKAGLWEMKLLHQEMDGRDMTAQMAEAQQKAQAAIASMPPEQRAKIEAMMGGKAGAAALGGPTRICVSPAMAARDKPVMDPKNHCEPGTFTHTGNKMTFEMSCKTAQGTMNGKGESVNNGDTVDTKMNMTTTDARGTHNMVMESQMTFLGADCQGVKPLDQIAEEMKAPPKAP